MHNDSIIITRGQIGGWASAIGGSGLLLGLVGWLWQGGLTPFIIGALVVGVIGLVLWAALTPNEFKSFVRGRQVRYSTGAIFSTLLLVGIVALAYVVIQRAVVTVDMTEGGRFSLSSETRQVLARVQQPIRITGFYSARNLNAREVDDQFIRMYEVESGGRVTRVYYNPDEENALALRFGLEYDGQLFISYLNPDGSVDFNSLARIPRSEGQERDVTGAINRLLLAGSLTVYFDQAKGEYDPLEAGQQGLSGINNGIRENGIITFPLNISELAAANGDIPTDAAAVIFARPTTDLNPAEIAVIDRYLQRGGALFLMTDILFTPDAFMAEAGTFNQYLWQNFGIRALDAALVDEGSNAQTPLDVVSAAVFADNQITQRMDSESLPALFRVARVVEANQTPPANVVNGQAILSSVQSYGERDLTLLGNTNSYGWNEGIDLPGPLASVVWANNRETGARILLVGDGDFVTNGLVQTGGNGVLFTDGLGWLTGFGEQVRFSPQAYTTGLPVIFISTQTLDVIAFVTIILLPGLVLALGAVIWARRMRA